MTNGPRRQQEVALTHGIVEKTGVLKSTLKSIPLFKKKRSSRENAETVYNITTIVICSCHQFVWKQAYVNSKFTLAKNT